MWWKRIVEKLELAPERMKSRTKWKGRRMLHSGGPNETEVGVESLKLISWPAHTFGDDSTPARKEEKGPLRGVGMGMVGLTVLNPAAAHRKRPQRNPPPTFKDTHPDEQWPASSHFVAAVQLKRPTRPNGAQFERAYAVQLLSPVPATDADPVRWELVELSPLYLGAGQDLQALRAADEQSFNTAVSIVERMNAALQDSSNDEVPGFCVRDVADRINEKETALPSLPPRQRDAQPPVRRPKGKFVRRKGVDGTMTRCLYELHDCGKLTKPKLFAALVSCCLCNHKPCTKIPVLSFGDKDRASLDFDCGVLTRHGSYAYKSVRTSCTRLQWLTKPLGVFPHVSPLPPPA